MMRKVNRQFVWLKEDSVNISHNIPYMFVSPSNGTISVVIEQIKSFLNRNGLLFKQVTIKVHNESNGFNKHNITIIIHDMWQKYSVTILQGDWHFTFDRQKINVNLPRYQSYCAQHVSGITRTYMKVLTKTCNYLSVQWINPKQFNLGQK